MTLKLYGIIAAAVLIIEFVIMQIPENAITDASMKIFNTVYESTLKSCERIDNMNSRQQCFQSAYNTKFAVDMIIPIGTAAGFVGLAAAVKRKLFDS